MTLTPEAQAHKEALEQQMQEKGAELFSMPFFSSMTEDERNRFIELMNIQGQYLNIVALENVNYDVSGTVSLASQ